MFPNGAGAYIDEIGKLINLNDGSIRTAIDTGCGVRLNFINFVFLLLDFCWNVCVILWVILIILILLEYSNYELYFKCFHWMIYLWWENVV